MAVEPGFIGCIDRAILPNGKYKKISRWTSSQTVHCDDGKTVEEKIGQINGITDDPNCTDASFAASIAIVSKLKELFQAGCSKIANKLTSLGTPTAINASPDTICNSIQNLYDGRYNQGYEQGYNDGGSVDAVNIHWDSNISNPSGGVYGGAEHTMLLTCRNKSKLIFDNMHYEPNNPDNPEIITGLQFLGNGSALLAEFKDRDRGRTEINVTGYSSVRVRFAVSGIQNDNHYRGRTYGQWHVHCEGIRFI